MGQGSGQRDQQEREEERAGRLPSLEEQTPGLDPEQEEETLHDAEAFFAKEGQEEGGDAPGSARGTGAR